MRAVSMINTRVTFLAIVFSTGSVAAGQFNLPKELEGTWVALSGHAAGHHIERFEGHVRFTADGMRMNAVAIGIEASDVFALSDVVDELDGLPMEQRDVDIETMDPESIRIDPKACPAQLDIEVGQRGFSIRGVNIRGFSITRPIYDKCIYSIEGQKLTICFGHTSRPKSFVTKKGDEFCTIVFEKVTDKEE